VRRIAATLVVLMLFAIPEVAAADWRSLRTEHFQLVGNTGERDLRTVALKLEQFRDVVSQLNPALLREGSAPPVTVLVFRDKRSYEPFMPRANGRVVPVTGYFQPGQDVNYITLMLEAGEQAYPVIFHEYAHLLLRGVFAGAPVWFNEGIAEYYSTLEMSTSRRANVGKAVQRHLRLLSERRLPFDRFFAVDRNSPEYTSDITERSVRRLSAAGDDVGELRAPDASPRNLSDVPSGAGRHRRSIGRGGGGGDSARRIHPHALVLGSARRLQSKRQRRTRCPGFSWKCLMKKTSWPARKSCRCF
jgi:hypothetical protein